MFIKTISAIFAALCMLITGTAHAFILMTEEEVMEKVFGKEAKVVNEAKELKGEVLRKILSRLGGRLVYEQEGSESEKVRDSARADFHFGTKEGNKTGLVIMDTQPGKWGPVRFAVSLDMQGAVKAVYVMSYEEKRGRPIAQVSYMRQYVGKTSQDPLEVGKDITGIGGATISSRCATFTVKKAIVLYEELYLKNQ